MPDSGASSVVVKEVAPAQIGLVKLDGLIGSLVKLDFQLLTEYVVSNIARIPLPGYAVVEGEAGEGEDAF